MRSPCKTCNQAGDRSTCSKTCAALSDYQDDLGDSDALAIHQEQVRRCQALVAAVLKRKSAIQGKRHVRAVERLSN